MAGSDLVAVITRTRDRPLLLKRAVASVRSQTYKNYIHIIVNDGDRPETAAYAREDTVVVPATCGGKVEVGANIGLRKAQELGADFITLHDDDDTWSPEFLSIMIKEFHFYKDRVPSVEGILCRCNRVYEHVEGNIITTDHLAPHAATLPEMGLLRLTDILDDNKNFTPLQFVYTTKVLKELVGYDESLPYGDWDFNLRFLQRYDIALIPNYLAFYHWRVDGPSQNFLTDRENSLQIRMY